MSPSSEFIIYYNTFYISCFFLGIAVIILGVVVRSFPLGANYTKLQSFVNGAGDIIGTLMCIVALLGGFVCYRFVMLAQLERVRYCMEALCVYLTALFADP